MCGRPRSLLRILPLLFSLLYRTSVPQKLSTDYRSMFWSCCLSYRFQTLDFPKKRASLERIEFLTKLNVLNKIAGLFGCKKEFLQQAPGWPSKTHEKNVLNIQADHCADGLLRIPRVVQSTGHTHTSATRRVGRERERESTIHSVNNSQWTANQIGLSNVHNAHYGRNMAHIMVQFHRPDSLSLSDNNASG